jgi:hypothetical protein
VLEAGHSAYMVYDTIEDLTLEIIIANPLQVKASADTVYYPDPENVYTIESVEQDDPITPSHSGFGIGCYALRSKVEFNGPAYIPPVDFVLHQNYPNPFNSMTTLQIELPQRFM